MAFETIRSASGVDFIGTDEADVLVAFNETGAIFANGRKANDTITFTQNVTGVLSTATVYGGEGTDTITVNNAVANSTINGNKGNDTLTAGNLAQAFFDGGADTDVLNVNNGSANSTIRGSKGNDTINLFAAFGTTTIASSLVNGNENNDTINLSNVGVTTAYNSTVVYGGADSDTITTNGGIGVFTNATINGNKGLDTITVTGGSASGLTIFGGEGTDTITATGIVQISDATKAANLYLSGDLGNDNITSGGGNDTIMGGNGNDVVNSGAGNDTIMGGEGNDSITAEAGTNRVIGGNGADTYTTPTAAGTDTFVIEEIANSQATVSGGTQGFDTFEAASFSTTVDKLDISAVASSLAGGDVGAGAATVVAATAAASGPTVAELNTVTNFGQLKTLLDATVGSVFTNASTSAAIKAYTFTIANGSATNIDGTYLWINDNQAAYNELDLMFNIGANTFANADIVTA